MNNKKKCNYCKTEINKSDKVCLNCKKKQGLPTWSIYLISIFVIIMIASAFSDVDEVTNTTNNPVSNLNSDVNTSTKSSTTTVPKVDIPTTSSVDSSTKSGTTTSSSVDTSTKVSNNTNQSNTVSDEKNYTVYITKTGEKYHRSGCRYLKKSCIETTLKDALASGYDACSVCKP